MDKIDIILSDLSYGANKMGIESGKDLLLEDKTIFSNETKVVKTELQKENFNRNNLKYLNTILHTCKKLSMITENSMKNKRFPLVIGGDHWTLSE